MPPSLFPHRAVISAALVSLLALSGCASANRTFTFADGQTLDESATVTWDDGLADDAEWEREESTDESGRSYRRVSDDCVAGYSVSDGMNYGTPFADDDDLDATNGVMNLAIDVALTEPTTGRFRLHSDRGTSVAMRQVTIEEDGRPGVFASRSFEAPGLTVIVFATCAHEADVADAFDEMVAQGAVVLTP